PAADDVNRELKRVGAATGSGAGQVRVRNLVGQVYVVLHAEDGREVSVARVRGETCAQLATEAAVAISRWEVPPVPSAASEPALRDLGQPLRLSASFVGAAFGALVPVVAAFAVPASGRKLALLLLEAGLGVPLTGLTALAAHYLVGGVGNYGAAVGGAALGAAAALVPLLFTPMNEWNQPYEHATVLVAAVLAMGTPAVLLELSDSKARDQLGAAVVPVNGGASVAVGGRF
ncbi:MAG: hypothetical protein JNK82_00700, partial [Myxococcaceae bacterium]|nr:hypothetical protein [Myxococcaceae bacterium]